MELQKPSISILYAEDDQVTREVLSVMIPRKYPDVTMYIAEDGKMGLELFKEHVPEIVITDIQMPLMDGIEMAREIKKIEVGTKFIVLTAFSNTDYYEKFNKIGFQSFLPKPIEFTQLFAAIEKCIAEITLERQQDRREPA